MSTLKAEITAAQSRHRLRCLGLAADRWAADRPGLLEGSRRLLEREVAEIRRRHANDNAQRVLSQVAGRETNYDPTGTSPSDDGDDNG